MTAVRPGDQATLTILAMQDELTADGYLPAWPGEPVRRIGATDHADRKAAYRARKAAQRPACPDQPVPYWPAYLPTAAAR